MVKQSGRSNRKIRSNWALFTAVLILVAAAVFGYTRPLPLVYPHVTLKLSAQGGSKLDWPSTGEAAVGAMNYGTLATYGNQTSRPTASVAKLITALTVLNKYPLSVGQTGPTITLTPTDVTIYNQYVAEDGSVVKVQAGEQITEYQALEAMMLPSANNIADSLAIWAFGSLASYSTYANQFVPTLGLTHTHVGSDASGFLPDTTSTPTDLVTLGIDVLKTPVIATITSESKATIPIVGTVNNVNWLLGDDGIIGLKTGNSDQAGGVYLFAANDNISSSQKVVIVGAEQGMTTLQDALNQAVPLLNSIKQNFELSTIIQAGQTVGYYKTPWGSVIPAIARSNLRTITWKYSVPKPLIAIDTLRSPQASGTTVGLINYNSADAPVYDQVTLGNPIPKPPLLWRIIRRNL